VLDAVRCIPFTGSEITALTSEMPLTRSLPTIYPDRPLGSYAAIFTIHHMTDFLVMLEAAISLGVRPEAVTVVDKEYGYLLRERVDAHIRQVVGAAVHRYSALDAGLQLHFRRARRAGLRTLILDDGGYVLPRVLTGTCAEMVVAEEVAGVVEQTSSGIWRLQPFEGHIPVPIFSVAESDLKATVESYGVADACVRSALKLLPNEKFEGRRAAVVGYGRIGREVADILRSRRMQVAVSDPNLIALIGARERGFKTYESVAALAADHRPLIIYGCGGRGAMGSADFAALTCDTYLVSTSSRNYEFDVEALRDTATAIDPVPQVGHRYTLPQQVHVTLLADGYPINFHLSESMPNRYSDVVLASMLVGACTLARSDHGFRNGHNLAMTNDVLATAPITRAYYELYNE
jgi:S-adenosylhomocysteine hydrolase